MHRQREASGFDGVVVITPNDERHGQFWEETLVAW